MRYALSGLAALFALCGCGAEDEDERARYTISSDRTLDTLDGDELLGVCLVNRARLLDVYTNDRACHAVIVPESADEESCREQVAECLSQPSVVERVLDLDEADCARQLSEPFAVCDAPFADYEDCVESMLEAFAQTPIPRCGEARDIEDDLADPPPGVDFAACRRLAEACPSLRAPI